MREFAGSFEKSVYRKGWKTVKLYFALSLQFRWKILQSFQLKYSQFRFHFFSRGFLSPHALQTNSMRGDV